MLWEDGPFRKEWFYFDRRLNEMIYQMYRLFPAATNRAIVVKQRWSGQGHFALIVDRIMDVQSDGASQCFPLYLYQDESRSGRKDHVMRKGLCRKEGCQRFPLPPADRQLR